MRKFNICRDSSAERTWLLRCLLALSAFLAFFCQAQALDPRRATSQYLFDQWNSGNGFPGGQVNSIAQTPDGYLWIGTSRGLIRFDGINFLDVQRSKPGMLSDTHILGLQTDSHGDLWIRMQGANVIRYHNGKFENVLSDLPPPPEEGVTAMSRGSNGEVLLSTLNHGTLRYGEGNVAELASAELVDRSLVISIAQTSDGRVWMGTRDDGLFYVDKGRVASITDGLPDRKVNSLLPDVGGSIWIGTDHGLVRWDGSKISAKNIPSSLRNIQVLIMIRDRDQNLWLGTSHGLLRLQDKGVSSWEAEKASSGSEVTALFEDREGCLWIGSTQGLERLRDGTFATYSVAEGLPSDNNGPIYVDAQDRTWIAPSKGGLYWMKDGRIERVMDSGLRDDVVYSIAGNKDEMWLGRQRGGLTRVFFRNGVISSNTYTHREGLAQDSVYAVHENRDGSIWAGTLSGGVSRLSDGRFKTYTMADGLGSNTVSAIEEGTNGTMWIATSQGLSKLSDGHWRTYTLQDGLPSEDVISLFMDSAGTLWIGTAGGLAFFRGNQIHSVRDLTESLRDPVFGLADHQNRSIWLATATHILRVSREGLLRGQLQDADLREYGLADGLLGTEGVRRDRSVVKDSQGRIWFSMNRGVSVADPSRPKDDAALAIVHIESLSADNRPLNLGGSVRIPPSKQRIVIGYIGLSLAIPDRVRYRYRLDGFDHEWSAPVASRQAVYTNLNPGSYLFRVLASNGNGVWNGSEAVLPFRMEPEFWQTRWFQASCALSLIFVAWLLYRLRMHQIKRQLNVRFEERLAERMRIAQDLHDTLLQGYLSASMQLHIAADHVPEESPAKPLLKRVLQLMQQVNEEGRNALRGLRSSIRETRGLEQELSRVPEKLEIQEQVRFRVIVDGPPQPLHPVIRDEVYRISQEALVNAFRHAQANSIEVEVEYAVSHLQVIVRDDGRGIDPHVLSSGKDGHWGLPGMRERAEGIGGKLRLLSRSSVGTEVELTVPGNVAYQRQPSTGFLGWWRNLRGKKGQRNKSKGDSDNERSSPHPRPERR